MLEWRDRAGKPGPHLPAQERLPVLHPFLIRPFLHCMVKRVSGGPFSAAAERHGEGTQPGGLKDLRTEQLWKGEWKEVSA